MNKCARKKSKSVPDIQPLLLKRDEESDATYSEIETPETDRSESPPNKAIKKTPDYISLKNKSSKCVTFSNEPTMEAEEAAVRRQKMELKLSNSRLEESLSVDRHRTLQNKYERTESILHALLQYIDCLNLELKASYHLCHELNDLVVNEKSLPLTEEISKLIKKLCEVKLVDEKCYVKNKIYEALEVDMDVENMATEYSKRKKDFNVATQNFRILLDTTHLNVLQIERLQRQYEGSISILIIKVAITQFRREIIIFICLY